MDLEKLHREESGRVLATLIRLLGDFDLAEEMLQEAYAVAPALPSVYTMWRRHCA